MGWDESNKCCITADGLLAGLKAIKQLLDGWIAANLTVRLDGEEKGRERWQEGEVCVCMFGSAAVSYVEVCAHAVARAVVGHAESG
jgi:hypothetical protein